jgi:hypothetical protein
MQDFEQEKPESVVQAVRAAMASIPESRLQEHIGGQFFRFAHGGRPVAEQQDIARTEIIAREIERQITNLRNGLLCDAESSDRPPPYAHAAIVDLPILDDQLISLDAFPTAERRLERNGFVFEMCPILQSFNSGYWLFQELCRVPDSISRSVRLDPLAVLPREAHLMVGFKAGVYGVPLDWAKIVSLKEEQHGKWTPDDPDSNAGFTEVVWTPRGGEVHFVCEELPADNAVLERGSRYLHAIFVPGRSHFVHVDGAIRFYTSEELVNRKATHVRRAGKVGRRVKIFRVDGNISSQLWSTLTSAFFMWNYDVANYVTGQTGLPAPT